jgi:hypothetical protein
VNGLSTPRQVMEAINVLHNWNLKVGQGRRLQFRPQPTVPLFKVGAWSGADFKDASKNSGEDIYNRSIVKGTGADGRPVEVSRRSVEQIGSTRDQLGSPNLQNPTFATDTTGWGVLPSGTVTRTTTAGEFDSSPAGGKFVPPGGGLGREIVGYCAGVFKAGNSYLLTFRLKASTTSEWYLRFGAFIGSVGDRVDKRITVGTAFSTVDIVWTPNADRDTSDTTITVAFGEVVPNAATLHFDSFAMYGDKPTIPDRRGFTRTHVHSMSQAITPEVGQQIADTFLQTHKRTPLKGDITVKGRGGVRRFLGDASVPPSELLIHTGELIHLAHQIDPDTGALGRDAPIDSVTWSEDEDTASVSLDSQRDNLAALLARYDLVAGNGR